MHMEMHWGEALADFLVDVKYAAIQNSSVWPGSWNLSSEEFSDATKLVHIMHSTNFVLNSLALTSLFHNYVFYKSRN